eukprot:SAG31_NODE_871_length_11335_cov_4.910822_13_plen_81_part_00
MHFGVRVWSSSVAREDASGHVSVPSGNSTVSSCAARRQGGYAGLGRTSVSAGARAVLLAVACAVQLGHGCHGANDGRQGQ